MITTLLEVHHDVQEGHLVRALLVERFKVTCQNILVVFPGTETLTVRIYL